MNRQGVSVRAYARARGVSHTAIQHAIKNGRLKPLPNGRIDPQVADAQLATNTDWSKQRVLGRAARAAIGEFEDLGVDAPAPADPSVAASFAKHRALREAWRAGLEQLNYQERSGKLVERAGASGVAYKTAKRARELLLSMPDRLTPILAPTTDPVEFHRLLTEECRRVATEISKNPLGEQPEENGNGSKA